MNYFATWNMYWRVSGTSPGISSVGSLDDETEQRLYLFCGFYVSLPMMYP